MLVLLRTDSRDSGSLGAEVFAGTTSLEDRACWVGMDRLGRHLERAMEFWSLGSVFDLRYPFI
jgi:hypothetical protein